jgi:hypothetical protein
MSNPLEPLSPQSTWSDARGENSAEAAQRELFEFLATSEVAAPSEASGPSQVQAPPLAADAAPQADVALASIPDLPDAADERSGAEPREHAHPAGLRRDADEACERAARSAAQVVDEVTQQNLRRLEATMSRLQIEAQVLYLPRAQQIAPARGMPLVEAPAANAAAFDAVIDRSSLRRTVHGSTVHHLPLQGSPPLPIWLREHEAPIRLPPPRRGGGLWQRIVKFFWVCAVAAPIAYVFAITTSPMHKYLTDVAGLRSGILLALSALQPTQYAPSSGRDLIAIAPTAAPDDSAKVPPSGGGMQLAAISPGAAVAAPTAAEAEPAPGIAAPAGEGAVASLDVDRAGTPQLVLEPPVQHVIATGEAGETEAKVADAPAGEAVATAKPAGRQDVSELIEQGKRFFEMGDLSAARILFTRAVKAGDAAAAVGMGMTYDPVALAGRGIRGVAADPDKARAWYERAKDMNSSGGPRRLEVSANR